MDNLTLSIMQIVGISGGTSLIIVILAGKLWEIWFNRIKEGQKAEFETQIQHLKFEQEKLNYISKTQFEAEFKMYQELSEACFEMILSNSILFPLGIDYVPEDKDEQKEFFIKRYNEATNKLFRYQNLLYKYSPFITKDLYEKFDNLRSLGQKQVNWYPDFVINKDKNADVIRELSKEKAECRERTTEINNCHTALIEDLRNYLKSLKVKNG